MNNSVTLPKNKPEDSELKDLYTNLERMIKENRKNESKVKNCINFINQSNQKLKVIVSKAITINGFKKGSIRRIPGSIVRSPAEI